MLVRIHKLLQKPGAKRIVFFNSRLFIYYLFHTPLYHLFPLFLLKVKIILALCLNAQSKYRDMGNSCFQGLSKSCYRSVYCGNVHSKFFIKLFLLPFPWNGDSLLHSLLKSNIGTNGITFVFCVIMWH